MSGTDLVTEAGLKSFIDTLAADLNGLSGSTGTGWFDLSTFTRANIAKEDTLLLGDVSDISLNASGTLKKITLPGLVEVQRRLLTNFSATDTSAGFSSDTYLAGSSILIPETPVVGSKYKLRFRVSKTAAGTATPIITLRIGAGSGGTGVIGDTARGTLTFGAGTAAADVAFVEVEAVFTSINSTTGAIELNCFAVTNLTTTGWSNGNKNPTGASGNFNNTSLAGLYIGCSYNGGASAVHTVTYVGAEYIP